jgi:putative hydrolase of the HAD superfamily
MPAMVRRALSAICLDAGHTLLYADPAPPVLYARAMSRLGRAVTPDEVAPAFADIWAAMQRDSPPGQDRYGSTPGGERAWWGRFVRRVLERLAHDAPWQPLLDELWQAFAEPSLWRTYPEVHPTLTALRGRGLRLAVVSNWDSRLPDILAGLDLVRHMDAVTVSRIEGVEKPDPEIFRRTLERLGATPEEAAHVGDSPIEDYRGASAAGLKAVLIDREGRFAADGLCRIERLDELLDLI